MEKSNRGSIIDDFTDSESISSTILLKIRLFKKRLNENRPLSNLLKHNMNPVDLFALLIRYEQFKYIEATVKLFF